MEELPAGITLLWSFGFVGVLGCNINRDRRCGRTKAVSDARPFAVCEPKGSCWRYAATPTIVATIWRALERPPRRGRAWEARNASARACSHSQFDSERSSSLFAVVRHRLEFDGVNTSRRYLQNNDTGHNTKNRSEDILSNHVTSSANRSDA